MKRTRWFAGLTVLATTLLTLSAGPAMAQKKPQPSAVLAVLEFDADWTQNINSTPVVPTVCQTPPYIAGINEVAIISLNGFVAPSGTSNDFLQLRAAASQNGGVFTPLPGLSSIEGLSDGAAHVAANKKMDLVAGITYVFGARFMAGGSVIAALSRCQATVTIVRLGS